MNWNPHKAHNMTYFRFALSSFWRRPLRSLITTAGVSIAVATAFSLLAFQRGYTRSLWTELDKLGAHILIVPKGCPYEAASLALHGANWPCYLKATYLEETRAVPGIAAIAPVFMSAFYNSEGRHTVYAGIDTNMLAIKPMWKMDGRFPGTNEILIGADVARKRNWRLGQTVTLPEVKNAQRVVAGVLQPTHSSDDGFIFMPLQDAPQRSLHPHELTHALLRLRDPNELDQVVKALRGCDAAMQMNIVPLAHLFGTIQSLANSTRWFLGCATLVALLAAGAGVASTLLIAISERAREIGVMRAVGASPMDVFRLIWLEAMQTCLIGGAIGTLVAFASMNAVESWLRARLPFNPGGEIMAWEWQVATVSMGASLLLGCFAGWLPAWRASRSTPREAMRAKDAFA